MSRNCIRCGNEIVDLNLSYEQKIEVRELLTQGLKITIVKKLRDEYRFSHREAKVIMAHLNKDFGKCKKCGYGELTEQYMACPKCKTFNYNLNPESPLSTIDK